MTQMPKNSDQIEKLCSKGLLSKCDCEADSLLRKSMVGLVQLEFCSSLASCGL